MSQVSPPLRIVLVGAILFMAVWFAALRPGAGEDAPAPAPAPAGNVATGAPAQSAPGKVAEAAKGAATSASSAASARAGESAPAAGTAPGTAPAAGTPVKAAATKVSAEKVSAKGLPAVVAKAVAAKKVIVLYFWNPKALDDRAMRREVAAISRHKGKVAVHVAKISAISRYAPITRGVEVQQSPTVVVVGRDRTAEKLEGYHSRRSISQAVADALRTKK